MNLRCWLGMHDLPDVRTADRLEWHRCRRCFRLFWIREDGWVPEGPMLRKGGVGHNPPPATNIPPVRKPAISGSYNPRPDDGPLPMGPSMMSPDGISMEIAIAEKAQGDSYEGYCPPPEQNPLRTPPPAPPRPPNECWNCSERAAQEMAEEAVAQAFAQFVTKMVGSYLGSEPIPGSAAAIAAGRRHRRASRCTR